MFLNKSARKGNNKKARENREIVVVNRVSKPNEDTTINVDVEGSTSRSLVMKVFQEGWMLDNWKAMCSYS